MAATGIPLDAVDFFDELAAENTRAWWRANKERWQASVRAPMEAVLAALEDEFGPAHLFRPNRDVRFSADKSPYKEHQGALATTTPGMGWYVQVSAAGLVTGGGYYPTGRDQLARLRAAVDAPASGTALQRVVDDLVAAGFEPRGPQVATRPRGVPADHPRLELMRYTSLVVVREHGEPPWLSTPEVVERVRADWRAVRPFVEWLTEHVGATEEPGRR
ncbi:MAG TPA: DUF2461 domain-containing protein [Phycicoccus sp.]|nr:DUF2461 domain-containing protein [Phycicoccus sp.]